MDTTKEYIKQCEKAEEIQEGWKPQIGDWIAGEWYIDDKDNIGLCCKGIIRRLNPEGHSDCVDTGGSIFWNIDNHIWLPTQDRLQEMMGEKTDDLLAHFYDFLRSPYYPTSPNADFYLETVKHFPSVEQLWLAFVMKENYNKVWNGEDWISSVH